MQMKQYIIDTFRYNDHANRLALEKMRELSDREECTRLFSHLINSMNKWLGRIRSSPGCKELDWFLPLYTFDELEPKWNECLEAWIEFVNSKREDELDDEVEFMGFDGHDFAARLADIALQLNYHSIHHRAQIQMLIRAQGVEPAFVDYIGTRYRRLDAD